jgi:acetoacetate decarboxylase
MSQKNRWVREVTASPEAGDLRLPSTPQLEVTYLTDPAVLAAVLPPPLEAPAEPRVHVRVTDINLEFGKFKHRERIAYFAVDAGFRGEPGEYPLLMPLDLESAISISREKFGEPKELAQVELLREGGHVEGRVTRNDVSFIEIAADVTETLPNPDVYTTTQWWFKFLPAVSGDGFDAGPFLVRADDVTTTESLEKLDGKLVLRELATDPVVDLPVREMVSMRFRVYTAIHKTRLVEEVDAEAFKPYLHTRYDGF